jgi:hypothetical protein
LRWLDYCECFAVSGFLKIRDSNSVVDELHPAMAERLLLAWQRWEYLGGDELYEDLIHWQIRCVETLRMLGETEGEIAKCEALRHPVYERERLTAMNKKGEVWGVKLPKDER